MFLVWPTFTGDPMDNSSKKLFMDYLPTPPRISQTQPAVSKTYVDNNSVVLVVAY